MRQNYLFIPSFVFNAMRHSLTKAQFGEVISSVADSINSNDDAPSTSIAKGSDKYAFYNIVLEATKMQGASGRSSRSKSANGLLLPMMNLLAMHDNLTNSDLAEVVCKAADFTEGVQIEVFDKSSAMAAHFSMLVRSMDLQSDTNKPKTAIVARKGKSSSKSKVQKSANTEKPVVSEGNTEITNPHEEAENVAVAFEELSAKFGGFDNGEYLAKSNEIWCSLTVEEKRAAFDSVESYLSRPDAQHYLFQYLSHKMWLAD